MQNPGRGTRIAPQVQMVRGVPRIVTTSQLDLNSAVYADPRTSHRYTSRSDVTSGIEQDLLNDPDVMKHIPGTYDTYECKDCNIVFSGYKRGDPGLIEHIRSGGGRCRYVKAAYSGREKELLILQGTLRFQRGFLAFPEFVLYSEDRYVTIDRTEYCIVCASTSSRAHYIACADMGDRLKKSLKYLKLDVPIDNVPLFTARAPGRVYSLGDIETDSALAYVTSDFSVLGESANMYHLPQTVDAHKCFQCDLTINNFVQNDTLLGEHIYHKYNTGGCCPYIAHRFRNREQELTLILGKERYRKGYIAFPDTVTDATYGYTEIDRLNRCVVCGAVTIQGRYLPTLGHHPRCNEMKRSLRMKLKNMKFLL